MSGDSSINKDLQTIEIEPIDVVIMCCRFHHDGRFLLAVGDHYGCIRIFNINSESDKPIYILQDKDTKEKKTVTSINFLNGKQQHLQQQRQDKEHRLMASYADGMVKFWHYTSQQCLATVMEEKNREIQMAIFNNDCSKFVTAGADGLKDENPSIRIYDVEKKGLISTMYASDTKTTMNGHRSKVFAIKYNPFERNQFISGGWDNTIMFWDEGSKHAIRKTAGHSGPHICGDALDIDVHNHILTGSCRLDKGLQVWDYGTGELVKEFQSDPLHKTQYNCCQWLGTDNILCGGKENNLCRVIDRGTRNIIWEHSDLEAAVYCVDSIEIGNNSHKIAFCLGNKILLTKQPNKKT